MGPCAGSYTAGILHIVGGLQYSGEDTFSTHEVLRLVMAAKKNASKATATRKKSAPAKTAKAKTSSDQAELTQITITLDTNERVPWFTTTKSENEQLRGLKCSEAELIKKAARASGIKPDRIVRLGMQAYAKRLLANAANSDPAGSKGIAGANDPAFRDAYNALKKDGGEAITPSRIAYRAALLTENPALARAFRSAERWFSIHHPDEYAAYEASRKTRQQGVSA